MLNWIQSFGDLLAGLGALSAAFVAVFAIRSQQASNVRALAAQADATDRARHQQDRLNADQRLWTRRADLYVRITSAMGTYVRDESPRGEQRLHLGDVADMSNLASEADIFASPEARDLINEFVYDDPRIERKIDIWAEFQAVARVELTAGDP